MKDGEIILYKVWRSEFARLVLFLFTSVGCVIWSWQVPASVLKGSLFSIGNYEIFLKLPLWWLLPASILLNAIWRIYDVRYYFNSDGIEARSGILWVHYTVTRIRFEDIRSNELEQSIIERILNVGCIELGTAAQGNIEVYLDGVASPGEVQSMIQTEQRRRQESVMSKAAGV